MVEYTRNELEWEGYRSGTLQIRWHPIPNFPNLYTPCHVTWIVRFKLNQNQMPSVDSQSVDNWLPLFPFRFNSPHIFP